jgi:ribulose-phosphate 3-epimerase
MRHETVVDGDDVMTAMDAEAHAAAFDAQSQSRAKGAIRKRRRGHHFGVGEAAGSRQRLAHDAGLQLDLGGRHHVLPAAAATAGSHESTGRGLTGGGRFEYRLQAGSREVLPLLDERSTHPLPRQRGGDEHHAPVGRPGKPVAAGDDALDGQLDSCRGDGAKVAPRGGTVDAVGRPVLIAPSVLPADFARLGEEVRALEAAGVDVIQWDVMDGRFVPNLTFGPDVIAAARPYAGVPFEAHLMVQDPDLLAERYVAAGCQRLIVHAESTLHLHRTLGHVRSLGANAGVALNPATPPEAVEHVLDLVDLVLVMTVNPGFGGQDYLATMEPKIGTVRRMLDDRGLDVDVEVDGGLRPETATGAVAAGANVLVAGSALYRDPDGLAHAVSALRAAADGALSAPPPG